MRQKIMMGLGLAILIGGGSYAAYDFSRRATVELGDSCGSDEHCKTGKCIKAGSSFSGVCAQACGSDEECGSGQSCQSVDYTDAAGNTFKDFDSYCIAE